MARALEGIRIIDFTWVLAGPAMTRYLADYGAEVIQVESSTHPDVIRTSPPYHGGKQTMNNSGYWATYHLNKYSASININHPKGPELIKKLVAEADVVVENFIPGTMEKWGLGYDELVKVNPDLIMVSISLFGQSGPFKRRFGFGAFAEGMCGIFNLIGWPDRSPNYFQQVIGDAVTPFCAVTALMSALIHRDRTGEGQWIDVNQLDVCSYMMAPLLLDSSINGREASRCGNCSPGSSPHAVYPCAGEDKWCAIAVSSDAEWQSLCAAMGNPEWSRDLKFATFAGRKENEAELDKNIGTWTVKYAPQDLMNLLQARGVPAGAVISGRGIYEDPQLQHREAVWYVDHPEIGRCGYLTAPYKLSATPAEPRIPPPLMGEHTERVCTEILKMSMEDFIQLLNEGVFI
ncbi:MAG: CoA transferase [Dehalococcoidales bacterium]|nr:CoA transferase [Dehalococcoidales bacterium]